MFLNGETLNGAHEPPLATPIYRLLPPLAAYTKKAPQPGGKAAPVVAVGQPPPPGFCIGNLPRRSHP